MKCERLVPELIVVCDTGHEIILRLEEGDNMIWEVLWNEEDVLTVAEIYELSRSILKKTSKELINELLVVVFGESFFINRKTTKESFMNDLIGNVRVDATIDILE